MHEQGGYLCGQYEPLDPAVLPPLYVAYNPDVSEPTEVFHNDIRSRFNRGDKAINLAHVTHIGMNTNRFDTVFTRYPGSAASWQDTRLPHTTAFVVELPPGSPAPVAVERYVRAVEAVGG